MQRNETRRKEMEVEEALSLILDRIQPKEYEIMIPLQQACGKVVSRNIVSELMIPPFPKSAMDGYAVYAADTRTASREHPVQLTVLGEMLAGDDKDLIGRPGTAVRIMTGGMIPDGYDAVVKQEDTDYGEDIVEIYGSVAPDQNYCQIGEDIRIGDMLIAKGTRITPVHMGLLASIGMEQVPVIEPMKVALIATGSEIMMPGQPLQRAKIYNSITYMLAGVLDSYGIQVTQMLHCKDDEISLQNMIRDQIEQADVIITTGAVSVGKKDIVPHVLEELGAEILFRRVNIQPGTPTTASFLQDKLILSLSGNPYAAMANFDLYFWPVAAKLLGDPSLELPVKKAVLQTPYHKKIRLRRLVRAWYHDGVVELPSEVHASSVISNLTACNCYLDTEDRQQLLVGDEVTVRIFH